MSLLTDKQLELIAQEEEFLLFCDMDEFKQIAQHIEAIVCKELRQQLTANNPLLDEAADELDRQKVEIEVLRQQLSSRDAEIVKLHSIIESRQAELASVMRANSNKFDTIQRLNKQLADTKLVLGQAMTTVDDLQKSNMRLRNALRRLWNERTPDSLDEAGEALAATADLDGLILCHAKKVAWVSPLRYGSQVTFYKPVEPEEHGDGFDWYCYPLYRALQPTAGAAS